MTLRVTHVWRTHLWRVRSLDERGVHRGDQDALGTLRRMGEAGVVPSTDTFNTLMGACLARGDACAVPRLFRRLICLGHAPDALSYTALITSLTRLGRPHNAVRRIPSASLFCHDPCAVLASIWHVLGFTLQGCVALLSLHARQDPWCLPELDTGAPGDPLQSSSCNHEANGNQNGALQ